MHRFLRLFLALALAAFTLAAAAQTPARRSFVVSVRGHGPAMILIPGLNSSGATWDSTVAHYQNRYTCYVLTLAGFAGVPPITRPLLPTVEQDLAAYIEVHHLQRPVVMGHSLGGNIALDLAERHPQLVGPVVIVDSLPFYAGAWFGVKTLAQAQPTLAQMRDGMAHMTETQYKAAAESGAYTKYMATSAAHLATLERWGASSDMQTYIQATLELVGEDLRPGLDKVTAPVLALGTWQGWVAQMAQGGIKLTRADFLQTFAEQYATVPHLHFAMADHSRHFIMWDDPAWFFGQLDAFLANPAQVTAVRGFAAQ